ncbi:MAG: hypothetical protein NC093_05670 [Alistipes sp.]|nr:hypothetical protein [Alistipes sp.]
MKKIISTTLAAMLSMTSASAIAMNSFAEGEDALDVPALYLKLADGQDVTIDDDGSIILSRDQIRYGLTLQAEVYIQDSTLSCWSVAPKIKCAQKLITMARAYDPLPKNGSPYRVYAYAEADENGNLICDNNSTYLTLDSIYNVINYTVERQRTITGDGSPLVPYGAASDSYPLLTFDMEISPNTPYGEHSVYFLTEQEDEPDQRCTTVAMRINGSTVLTPEVSGLNIKVTGSNLGDINNDGKVDASDASTALVAYSRVSTGSDSGLDELQFAAGDTDLNGKIDASDAAMILVYYSYASTTNDNVKTFADYFYPITPVNN